jgi:hypothetical protein
MLILIVSFGRFFEHEDEYDAEDDLIPVNFQTGSQPERCSWFGERARPGRSGSRPRDQVHLDTVLDLVRRKRSAGVPAGEFGRRPAACIQPAVRPRSETLRQLAAGDGGATRTVSRCTPRDPLLRVSLSNCLVRQGAPAFDAGARRTTAGAAVAPHFN